MREDLEKNKYRDCNNKEDGVIIRMTQIPNLSGFLGQFEITARGRQIEREKEGGGSWKGEEDTTG